MLALGFFSTVTAGPFGNILSRMQLGVRAAAGPTVSARTVLSGSRSVCDLSFDCEDSAHNARSGSCSNIITRSTWSQRGHGVRRTEGARGFSSLPTACTMSTGLWSKAPIGEGASLEGTRDEKIQVAAEGEKEEDGGGKTFVLESISPSSVAAFKQCPKLFYYRWVLRLPTPATRETLRGIAVHEVLSKFFEPGQQESRSPPLDRLHELFRGVITDLIASEKKEPKHGYHKLFQSRKDEVTWAVECMDLLANFVVFERVNSWDGAPWEVEFKMRHDFDLFVPAADDTNESGAGGGRAVRLGGDAAPASCGVSTSSVSRSPSDVSGMSVTGIIDRLDRCRDGKLRVVDYKTGKIPDLKYSDATNQKIMDDKFYQLQIYALLVERVLGEVPREMRIVYLKGPESVTRELDPRVLPAVEQDLRSIWDQIASFMRENNFPPRQSRLCDWCSFKDRCPAFAVEKTRAGVIGEGEDVRVK